MPGPLWWLLYLPFFAGAFLALQAGINGQLARQIGVDDVSGDGLPATLHMLQIAVAQ